MIKKRTIRKIGIFWACVFCLLSIWGMPEMGQAGQEDVSHQTHLTEARGPGLTNECAVCHSGTPSEANPNLTYDSCIPCHSPDGAYDGVDDPDIGARYNWGKDLSKIYDTNGLLKIEKRKWCVGCHDDGNCEIQDVQAPSITGLSESGVWETPVSILSSTVTGADNLLDGNLETGCTGGEIIFDLGDSLGIISHIRLYTVAATIKWKVYASNDLNTWTKIVIGQSVIWSAPVWETGQQDGWNEIKLDKFIPSRYLKLSKISAWPLESNVLREFEFKKDIQFGYYTTGHRISCDICHNTASVHIDGISQTYKADLNNYQNGYRLNEVEVDGEIVPPLEIPRIGCNWEEYPRTDNDFALCFTCHDKNQLLGDAYSVTDLYPNVDNLDAVTTGIWDEGSGTAGYYGTNYLYSEGVAGEATATCTWTPDLPKEGIYKVYARWTSWTNRATNAQYIIHHSGADTLAPPQDQTQNGGTWVLLGTFAFGGSGNEYVTLTNAANNYVIADAVKFEEYVPIVDNMDATTTGIWDEGSSTAGYYGTNYLYSEGVTGEATATCIWTPNLPSAGEYNVYARWTSYNNRATNAQYAIRHSGIDTVAPPQDQTQNGGTWVLLGNFQFDGSGDEYVTLTNVADNYVIADAVRFGEFETVLLQTNFRNDQHKDEMDQVTNEHLRHLRGRYYCGNGADWDSDWDGVADSPQSCPSCHNIHGSPSPAMTRHGELTNTSGTADKSPMFNLQYINEMGEKDPDLLDVMESIGAQTQFYGPGPGYPGKNNTCNMCHNDQVTYYRIPVSTCGDCHMEVVNTHPSHSSHFAASLKGPNLDCYDCHSGSPEDRHLQLFADGKSLFETTVCDDCHSPGGAFDGSNDPVIGAKVNWQEGVYDPNTDYLELKPGLEDWCAGCHDDGTSICDGELAPNVMGDNTSYGFKVTGHGRTSAFPKMSWQDSSASGNPQANQLCTNCHDTFSTHITVGSSNIRLMSGFENDQNNSNCNQCHPPGSSAVGDPLFYTDSNSYELSAHSDTMCTDCHEVHGAIGVYTAMTRGDKQNLCYQCHTEGVIQNDALSNNRPGGYVSSDDIQEAFSKSTIHNLGTSFTNMGKTYTLQCVSCHNVHLITGKYWDAEQGDKTPVTRFPPGDEVNLEAWGDEPGEKMDDFAALGYGTGGFYYKTAQGYSLGAIGLPYDRPAVYQPPKSGSGYDFEFCGDLLPDYTSLCLDCHSERVSDANPPVNWGQGIGCTDNSVDPPNQRIECGAAHGLAPAGKPLYVSDEGKAGFWGSSGNPDVIFQMNYVTRGRHNGHFMRWPYDSADRGAGINFVTSCTDCHEAHGSNRGGLMRERFNVNANGDCGTGGDSSPNGENCNDGGLWNETCNVCHYYYGGQHAGMSCGNASCHEANSLHRIIHVTNSGAPTQLMITADGTDTEGVPYREKYQQPDFTPEIENATAQVGSNELTVTFRTSQYGAGNPGIYANSDLTGSLTADDFWLFDKSSTRTITGVSHTAGETTATIILSGPISEADYGQVTLSTTGKSVWGWYEGGYVNWATGEIEAQTVSAGPWPVTIMPSSQGCPEGATSFQLNESIGSLYALDEQYRLIGTVGNASAAFQGDGYFHGNGVDNSTYIYVENAGACLDEGKTLTYEVRFKPFVVDLDSEELNPGNSLDRTVQVLFERLYTYNVKISRADFWQDNNPPAGKAFIYIWYHPNNEPEGGRAWHQAFADGAGCYIEANHWYQLKMVFNSNRVGGIPVDFFLDDQGTDGLDSGETWAGYINCTRPPTQTDTYRATQENEIEPVAGKSSYPFSIGALAKNKNYTINGLIDWVTYQPVADYTGVDAPAPVQANVGDGQIQITWGTVVGATSYNIYWDTSSGVSKATGNKITGVTSPYTHTGLTYGTTYYYIVTAMKNVDGIPGDEEIASSEVNGMSVNASPNSPPVNVVAEGFKKAVILTWDDAYLATSYNIYWGTSPGVTTATGNQITGATSPYVHVGRTNGTTYYYIITAVNSLGESTDSIEVNGTANNLPTNVTAVAGDGQVQISWDAVSGATSYNIYWETDSEVTRATAAKIENVTSPYTHIGLTNGVTYSYVVTAVHPSGETFSPYPVNATPVLPE